MIHTYIMSDSQKKITQSDICNNDPKNMPTDIVYNAFNNFIFSNDTKLIGKLLHRFNFFKQTMDLPGDIVEIGVFKGSGIATFSKFVDIFCPNSNKKIIGFDIFNPVASDTILDKDSKLDKETMNAVYSKVNHNELTLESVNQRLEGMELHKKYMLVQGDVADTLPTFLKENPGFRASLIYIDVDLDRPTYHALNNLWERLLPGGIIVFDEYEYHKFSESRGVEQFLRERNLQYNVKSTHWIAPTAYIQKNTF